MWDSGIDSDDWYAMERIDTSPWGATDVRFPRTLGIEIALREVTLADLLELDDLDRAWEWGERIARQNPLYDLAVKAADGKEIGSWVATEVVGGRP